MKKIPFKIPTLTFTRPSWKGILMSRYLWTFVIAAVWLFFFDSFSILKQQKMKGNIEALKRDKAFYEDETRKVDYRRELIFSDREELERFARERYYMHRSNEDVYVVAENPEIPIPEQPVIISVGKFKPKEGPRQPFEAKDSVAPQGNPKAEIQGAE